MGRVRKYKKVKACDPFSKRGGGDGDVVHDEPPELFDQRVKSSKKRKQFDWDDEEQREILLQREAMRNMKVEEKKTTKKSATKIEGKRDDETLRDFKKRVREDMKKTLSEELQKMTATSKKKKEYLKDRKLKKKEMRNRAIAGNDYQQREEVIEFSAAANGHMRPSDLGLSSSSFAKRESFGFGERAERPPDLKLFVPRLEQQKAKSLQLKSEREGHGSKNSRRMVNNDSGGDSSDDDEDDEEEEDAVVSSSKRRRLNKQKPRIMDRLDMEGDDGLESVLVSKRQTAGIIHAGSHRQSGDGTSHGSKKKMPSSASTKNANFAEMEILRNRVQEAYKIVRDKRRADSAAQFNSSNRK